MALSEKQELVAKSAVLIASVAALVWVAKGPDPRPADAKEFHIVTPVGQERPAPPQPPPMPEPTPIPQAVAVPRDPEPAPALPANFLQLVMGKLPDCDDERSTSRVESILEETFGTNVKVMAAIGVKQDVERLRKICLARYKAPTGNVETISFQVEWTDVANGKYNVRMFARK